MLTIFLFLPLLMVFMFMNLSVRAIILSAFTLLPVSYASCLWWWCCWPGNRRFMDTGTSPTLNSVLNSENEVSVWNL